MPGILNDQSTLGAGAQPARDVPRVVCLVIYHKDGVETVPLPLGGEVVVGRASPSQVVIADELLSRRHARFAREDDGIFVEDLGSKNGTQVNGRNIEKTPIRAFDEICFGNVTAVVHAIGEERIEGVLSHDRFLMTLEDEVARARAFSRPLSLITIRALRESGGISVFLPRLRGMLREIDWVASYSREIAEVLLPETDSERALEVARRFTQSNGQGALLGVGVVSLGQGGCSSGQALISVGIEAVRRANPKTPIATLTEREREPESTEAVLASGPMRAMEDMVDRAARTRATVLLIGETGTGKEVMARLLHQRSLRATGPFVCLNCGALAPTLIESTLFGHERGAFTGAEQRTRGLFEEANGGTLFLDEIGELPLTAQATLLRVLETRKLSRLGSAREIEVDVRIVAATNRALNDMVRDGRFREDLLYRINTIELKIPALRDRVEDIEPLARRFLEHANRTHGTRVDTIDPSAMEVLKSYRWPGNVRELRNVIERAAIVCSGARIGTEDLSDALRAAQPVRSNDAVEAVLDPNMDLREKLRVVEIALIRECLDQVGGNQTEAARRLGLPVRTLSHKLKALGMRAQDG